MMRLSHEVPSDVTAQGRVRLEMVLNTSCPCTSESASLRRRPIAGGRLTVQVQCDGCGFNIGDALKFADFPAWETYPVWDYSKAERYQEQSRQALDERRTEVLLQLAEKRANYDFWCRTSDEWKALRYAIIQRAGGKCEACLRQPAVTAHHLTYRYGKAPPAWQLRAVCKLCHERFHADKRGETDDWCIAQGL